MKWTRQKYGKKRTSDRHPQSSEEVVIAVLGAVIRLQRNLRSDRMGWTFTSEVPVAWRNSAMVSNNSSYWFIFL